MKRILFVLALAAIILASCGPTQPKGTLAFVDLYDKDNLQFLPITGGRGAPIVTSVNMPILTTYVAPDGSQLVAWDFDENGPGTTIYVYSTRDLASPIVLKSPKELDPIRSSNDIGFFWEDGSLYLATYHYNAVADQTIFTIYRLTGSVFIRVRSFSPGPGFYYVNRGRGGNTPDFGKMLIADRGDVMLSNIFVYDTVTGDMTKILGDPWEIVSSDISPDGKYLLYYSYYTGCLISYRISDGQEQKVVCPEDKFLEFSSKSVTLSPNGKNMAWTVEINRELMRIYVFNVSNPDNSIVKQSYDAPEIFDATWSPDSRYLAFYADPGGDPGFYIMDVATGKTERVYSQPNWKEYYTQDGGIRPFWVIGWIK